MPNERPRFDYVRGPIDESIPLDPPRPERDDPMYRTCGLSEGEGHGVPRARQLIKEKSIEEE